MAYIIVAGVVTGAIAGLLLCEVELALTLAFHNVDAVRLLGPAWPFLLAIYSAAGAAAGLLAALALWPLRRAFRLEAALSQPTAFFARFWILSLGFFIFFVWVNNEVLHPAMNPAVLWLDAVVLLIAGAVGLKFIGRFRSPSPRFARAIAAVPILLALASLSPIALSRREVQRSILPRTTAERAVNVIVVTIDTLRASQLGCYGYPRPTSPVMDKLAGEGIRMSAAWTGSTQTDPSHASIFTGLYPPHHGVTRNGFDLPDANVTLAERLTAAGYETFAAVSASHLSSHFGYGQGFQTFRNCSRLDRFFPYSRSKHSFFSIPIVLRSDAVSMLLGKPLVSSVRPADGATHDFLQWLDGHDPSKPFLAWIHYFDPHAPYEPPPGYAERFASLPQAIPPGAARSAGVQDRFNQYDGEVAYADSQLGRIIEAIDRRGLKERTLILVTSDHGESLGEHHTRGHDGMPYDEIMRVPLMVRLPGTLPAGITMDTPASLLDVTPTILAFLGLPGPKGFDGRALPLPTPSMSHVTSPPRAIYAYSETWADRLQLGMVRDQFKLVESRVLSTGGVNSPAELYDLRHDPFELSNLAASEPDRAAGMGRTMSSVLKAAPRRGKLDDQTYRLLRSLGYIQ